jgi:16S rRNA (cytosine1402-N4)-methyltransferase
MTEPTPPTPPAAERHVPVMLDRIVELLAPALAEPGSVVVDCTLGLGGHARALLEAAPQARLVGLDRDPQALAAAGERLHEYRQRIELVPAVYDELPEVLEDLGITSVSSVLLDLGVSSLQLDEVQRGFSYARDAPLDMRMDQTTGITAADIVNGYSPGDLARVLRDYGEERFTRRIVSAIMSARAKAPLAGTAELAELVRDAVPAATRRTGGHPAKRTFQALRIEVNRELDALGRVLPAALAALGANGRIAVLAYHSLEDRLVKRAFAAQAHPDVPPDMPVIPASLAPTLRLLTRGAERPADAETEVNPRAASARLRAAERIGQVAA